MDITPELGAGIIIFVLGFMLVRLRHGFSRYMVTLYQKIGVDVPEDKYAKQFAFVGIITSVLGILVATGLIHHL